ncbi:MAG: efflux RND transporter permease subunit [Thiobacillaceae bacterium]|jgi:multidrug efflux pump subunit AcrB|nr:efflux RND transporter permease subunit [Thiobacillaceae bacterium]
MKRQDTLAAFAHHPVAGNLLMIILIVAGLFALTRLNVQFFPNFSLDVITVRVEWRGATAEDVEEGITTPLEQKLKSVAGLKKLTSTSSQGVSSITIELVEDTDPVTALDEVKQAVSLFRNLPTDAEPPETTRVIRYEPIARLLVTGGNRDELRHLARRFERELLAGGIDKVDLVGLPEEEIAVDIPHRELERLGMSLDQVAARLAAVNRDAPAGKLGGAEVEREVRGANLRKDPRDYADLPLVTEAGTRIELGQVARVERRARDNSMFLEVDGRPAVELLLKRAEEGNSLKAAAAFHAWLDATRPTLPKSVELLVYDEQWSLIEERIGLLVSNGLMGLCIVVGILLLFLNGRVTLWVALGIPTAFLATLAVLWLAGGSINMISLFALIMALGVIVDDAIVVGEDAYAHRRMGEPPLAAAEGGARRMYWPVIASSLTTVAAFIPLMMVSGPIGMIMFDIPFIMVCVLIASVIECFFILPAHLRDAFLREPANRVSRVRQRLEMGFDHLRDGPFRRLVSAAVDWRGTTVVAGVALLMLIVGLLAGGRVKFNFFPTPEPYMVFANATFASGTPRARVDAFLDHLQATLDATEKSFDTRLVEQSVSRAGGLAGDAQLREGEQFGALSVQLIPSDQREVRTDDFVAAWQSRIQVPAGMESFVVAPRRQGPPGSDIQIRLTGRDPHTLKQAALDVQGVLRQIPGVYGVEDDMPYGREQLVFTLTAAGEALGLTTDELSRQLRAAFDGRLVQIFQDGPEEVEVRVRLSERDRASLAALERLTVRTQAGEWVPLASVAHWQTRQGFEALRHAETELAVEVNAQVNSEMANASEILAGLSENTLPDLMDRHGVRWSFEGRAADQRETLADMRVGLMLGLALIYLILAWVFAHFGWPLIIMLAIPFGLGGAILGHWAMDINLTVLSLFGLFGLSGIVVNDSIILTEFYRHQRDKGMPVREALIEAACLRLRAILLTSLTTIGGLSSLMLETSLQAQFLIPMATSITFGLAVTTVVSLLWLPAMLSLYESVHERLMRLRAPRVA